jgi:phosphoribosylamine--glycine ligase
MNSEGRKFKGCLYFGLMLTPKGPKVIEYNCRFGDPETQVVLPLLKTDLFEIMQAVANENLADIKVEFEDKSACCVIMASKGYPEKYDKGFEISFEEDLDNVFVAGANLVDGKLLTNGGRVLGVTAIHSDLEKAIEEAYKKVQKIKFSNAFYRKDIGQRALKAYGEK